MLFLYFFVFSFFCRQFLYPKKNNLKNANRYVTKSIFHIFPSPIYQSADSSIKSRSSVASADGSLGSMTTATRGGPPPLRQDKRPAILVIWLEKWVMRAKNMTLESLLSLSFQRYPLYWLVLALHYWAWL